jgi:predicted ATPase
MIIRTPDQRLRVFVSSTLQEVAEERAAAREAITRLRLAPVMFEIGARPHPPQDLYRAYLEQSHIFIGIYWERYGWVAPDMDISGLEDEWQLSGDRPKLIYVKSPAPNREPRLKAMLDQIRDSGNASYKPFTTAAELQQLIENDLAILLTERFEMTRPATVAAASAARPSNLPTPATPLIGREREVAQIADVLLHADKRLVTLYGPGGIGKTRLAVEVGHRVGNHFEHGVFLAPLADITDHNLVVPAIGQALGLGETRSAGLAERVMTTLRDRQMLLILDNFEQVMPAAVEVADLLTAAPRIEVIVTSRTVLNVRGEYEYAVPTLALPASAPGGANFARLNQSPAVQLFLLYARAVKPGFALNGANVQAVADICARLDGLPLAIELAAARVKLLSPQAILSRLIDAEQKTRLLSSGARDLPIRQQTLQNTLDWSYGLLEPREQTLFARLSVFVGGWTLETAAAVCGFDSDELDVMDTLSSLADKSLIVRADGEAERFHMLNTIGDYAAARLNASGEADVLNRHHADCFLALVERVEPELKGVNQQATLMRMDGENANIQATLGWLIDNGAPEVAARMGWALRVYWLITSRLSEGLRWMISALSRLDVTPDSPLPLIEARAQALAVAGLSAAWQGNADWATFLLTEADGLCARLHAPSMSGLVSAGLAIAALENEDAQASHALFEKSLTLFRQAGDTWGAAMVLSGLERLATRRGDFAATQRIYQESQALAQLLGDGVSASLATFELGRMDLVRGEAAQAEQRFHKALQLAAGAGYREGIARSLEGLASAASACNQGERAAQLLGAAHAMRDTIGLQVWQEDNPAYVNVINTVRAQAGDKYDEAWARGVSMSAAEVITFALAPAQATPIAQAEGQT